ncbi:MAG: YhbY family RNA-binding protein [Aerococcus sp.]|nr:YhbY family RNA-binding protein [Aerococcus sp.]
MNNKQKSFLRRAAQREKALFQLGKANITDEFINQLNDALDKRELVKVSILQNATISDQEAEALLREQLDAEWINHIGHTLSIYRTSHVADNRELSLRVNGMRANG